MTETPLPTDLSYGKVVGRFLIAKTDGPDAGRLPDGLPASGQVVFEPLITHSKGYLPVPTTVFNVKHRSQIDPDGYLTDEMHEPGIWLPVGNWKVTYLFDDVKVISHSILVESTNTDANPVDLIDYQSSGGPILRPSEYAELNDRISKIEIDGITSHADTHGIEGSDPITPSSIGAAPVKHASQHATGQPDAITPASIGAVNGVATQLPGGWATMDANVLLAAGRYALYAGSSLNIPSAGGGVVGILEVMPRTSTSSDQIYQRWTVMGSASGNPIGIWVRSTYNGGVTWGTWERVDNNALKPSDIGAADLYATSMTAAGTNVNTLMTPGTYLVSQSAVNTPGSYTGHIMTFSRKDAPRYTHQRFTALTGTSPGMEWNRTSLDGGITWTAWILVGGADTGWRSTTAFLSATFVLDKAQIRRVGNMVYVNLQATAMPTVNSYVASGMPAGFRPSSSGVAFPITAYSPSAATASLGHFGLNSSGTTFLRPSGVAGSLYFECSYLTDNAWPTTLPGTPA